MASTCSFINNPQKSNWKIYLVIKAIFVNGRNNIDIEVMRKVKARKIATVPFQEILLYWIQETILNKIQLTVGSWELLFWLLAIETFKCCSCCPRVWNEYIKCMHLETENVGLDKAQETKSYLHIQQKPRTGRTRGYTVTRLLAAWKQLTWNKSRAWLFKQILLPQAV